MIKNTKECTLETARKKVEASVRAQLAVCHVTGTTLATISVQKTQGVDTGVYHVYNYVPIREIISLFREAYGFPLFLLHQHPTINI